METTAAFDGFRRPTDRTHVTADERAPREGELETQYDTDALARVHERLFDEETDDRRGLARFAPALPFPAERLLALGAGATPLVEGPETESFEALVKLEGTNPTGGVTDREMALSVTAAREAGATEVVLPTTGNAGQSAAAYAGRAGVDCRAFVPSRSSFDNKAMVNVHGGEMDVVGGRYPDALAAFEDVLADADDPPHSLAPMETPYRQEGAKTLAYELAPHEPDAVVLPVGQVTTLLGLERGFTELVETDTLAARPRLYAVQPAGCGPLADALSAGERTVEPVEYPDAICGTLEIPDPAGGDRALAALEASGGGAVAVEDDRLLDAALEYARGGVSTSATGGASVAGARALAERGEIDAGERVVLVDPATANRETDLLRSRLMSEGV
jgi:threonine synthase